VIVEGLLDEAWREAQREETTVYFQKTLSRAMNDGAMVVWITVISLAKDKLGDIYLCLPNNRTLPKPNELSKETHTTNAGNLEPSRYPFIHRDTKASTLSTGPVPHGRQHRV